MRTCPEKEATSSRDKRAKLANEDADDDSIRVESSDEDDLNLWEPQLQPNPFAGAKREPAVFSDMITCSMASHGVSDQFPDPESEDDAIDPGPVPECGDIDNHRLLE